MEDVLMISIYLICIAWLFFMIGDSVGTLVSARKKILKLLEDELQNEELDIEENLNYYRQKEKYRKYKRGRYLVLVVLIIVLCFFIRAMKEYCTTLNFSEIVMVIILAIIVATVVFYLSYESAEYYINDSYVPVILIKESDNSQLEFVSNGKRIVKITRVTYVNGETKMEKIQVTPEMIELLNKNVEDQRYLLY